MTTFYLIRHAERIENQQLLVGRSPGISLTERGRRQAERLARHLANEPIRRIYSSPMERARETAAPLARVKGIEVDVCAAIHEIDAGEWTGKTFPELDATSPAWNQFNRFRSAIPIPGGESM